MSASATAAALDQLARPLRRLRMLAWATLALGGSALVLGSLAWSARLNWVAEPSWVLVAWALALVVLLGIGILAWRFRAGLSLRSLAQWLEARGGRRGSLTAHLDHAAPGTSSDLFALADTRVAGELTRSGADTVAPLRAAWQGRARLASGLAVAGVVALWSSGPTHGVPSLLWRPRAAWVATTAPLQLRLSSTDVARGERVMVDIEALGRRQGILWLRAPGESWHGRGLRLDSLGQIRDTLGPLESDLFVRFTSGGRSSDTLQVRVRIPAFLGSLALAARYPRYLSREDEPVPTDGDTIFVPAGTRLEATGEATADLARAEWQSSGGKLPLTISGSRFSGAFVPSGTRVYQLVLVTTTGMPLVGDTVRIPVVTVPDSAPHIDVPVPGADTVAPLSLRVPLVMDVQDDHGVQKVVLESRRISRLGFSDPAQLVALSLPAGNQPRLILPYDLDLNQRGLLPGDTVRYLVHAYDNAPTPNAATSREYVLRLPTLSEIRKATRDATSAMAGALDSLAQASKKLERQTEDLAQEHPRQDTDRPGGSDESLSFEAAKRTEAVAQSQEALQKQVDEIKQSLESLQKSAEAAGVNDPEFQKRLQEIQQQLDRALTPELREKLAELQKALQDLDPERTQEALKDLAQAQEQLREALERSKELFRRAALEGDLANLTAESKELARAQEQWTEQAMTADTNRAAAEERDLAARTDSLAKALSAVGEQLTPEGKQEAMQQAADQASQAGQQMQQAAKSASQGQRKQAQQQGRQASQTLKPLGDQLEKQKQDLQQEWKQEVTAALDRALSETSRLTERQLAVSEAFKQGDTSPAVRAEQAALEEGVERLLQQMKDASGKNAMVSQGSSVALSTARDEMRQAREALANAAPNPREAGRRSGEAVDALNTAAYQLIRSRGDVEGAGSGSGLAEAMERMSQMASQQGQLGQQSGGLLPMAGPGAASAVQEQIRRLGAQQRALAEQLERMRAEGNMPGSADLADEAKDLARRLEAGRLDRQTVERQERLFRRMLDAGRTLQGHEEDEQKERQSTTANNDSVRLPPALKSLLQGNDATLRVPSWEQLQSLSPDQRRLVVEYFRRLAEQTEKVSGER